MVKDCNQVRHKAAECTNARAAQVSEVGTEVQVGSVEGGGVWAVACVEKVEVPNKTLPQYIEVSTKVQHLLQGMQ